MSDTSLIWCQIGRQHDSVTQNGISRQKAFSQPQTGHEGNRHADDHNQEGLQHPSRRHFARNHMTEHLPIECGKGQTDNNGNNSKPDDNTGKGPSNNGAPQTGDTNTMAILLAVFISSAAGLLTTILFPLWKKKKEAGTHETE